MWAHPAPMFLVIDVSPFTKWGIKFNTCNSASSRGNRYIIIPVDYLTKWVEAMPRFNNYGETSTLFIFNQIVERFRILKEIVTDHGSHFQNKMMTKLMSNLRFKQENLLPYYLQVNGQVEAVNKSLKKILQWTINSSKSNWNLMLYYVLWEYKTSVKTATSFSPFQLVYGLEEVLPIEWHIPSLNLVVELLSDTSALDEFLLYLEKLDEQCRDVASTNETHKQQFMFQYDWYVHPQIFSKGDLFLVYDQDKYPLGESKLKTMWFRPFIVKDFLKKGAYHLVDFEGSSLEDPRNGIYLKNYYS
jgi:hypothetical protein